MNGVARNSVVMMGLLVLGWTSAAFAQGGGFIIYENGSIDMAHSYAGQAARAQDAATAFLNPAGMTRLTENELSLGGMAIITDLKFDVDPSGSMTIPPGQTEGGGQIGSFSPGFGSAGVIALNERTRFGFSIGALAASGVDYSPNWIGRSYVTEADAIVAAFVPSIAYKVNDWLSIGGGVDIIYGRLDYDLKASNQLDAPTIEITEADDIVIGGRIGAMAELSESTRLGLLYRFEADLELGGDIETTLPMTVNFDADFNIPMGLNLSVYHQLNDQWALLGDVGWTDWSHFSQMPITVGPATVPFDRDWDDTWRVGIGAEYNFKENWWLRTGFSYDSSPVDDDNRLPDLPVGEQFRGSIGVQHDLGEGKTFGISYTLLYTPMDIDQVQIPSGVIIDGEYDTAFVHFIGMNLTLTF